jgi:hypothetical protein
MIASGGMIGGAIGGLAYPVVLLIFYFRASTKKQFVRAIEVACGASFKNKHPWAMASLLTVITFFFLILSIGVISKYQRATTSKDRGWKLYSNKAYNVAFYYPESWLIGDSQKLHLQETPPLVIIYDPVENVEQFSSNINLLVQHSPYLAQSAEDQANATVIWFQQIGNSMGMKDFEKLSYEPIANKFGNTKAGLLIYEYTVAQNDKRLKVMQLIIPKGGITYWLTFTSTPTMWDAYKPVFDKIVSSFALQ